MHDADAGRHDAECLERLLAPLEQLVALAVAGEFQVQVQLQCVGAAEEIHLHRVVHDEIDRHERLDHFRVAPEALHRRTHRGEIHEQRNAGEILQDDARDHEGNFHLRGSLRVPIRERLHVLPVHFLAIAIAQHGFEDDADRDRQF